MSARVLAAMLVLAAAAPAAAAGQGTGAATLRGIVYDSIADAPLGNAAVFLWETSYKAVTDDQGRFVIEQVPPGSYTVLFFHTLLGEMGASPGARQVELSAGDDLSIELATPSMFTLIASECLLEGQAAGTATVAGWVGDGESGTGIPGARVTLSWSPADAGRVRTLELRSDLGGWYRTCEAPADVPIMASASFLDREGRRREVTAREGQSVEAGFLLYRLSPTAVHGTLLDRETGGAVPDADVWLRGTSHRTISRADGTFEFPQVAAGTYMLMTEHLRYGLKRDTLEVPSGERLSVEMRVDEQPLEVAPITVEVEAQPLTERAMGGTTITRADVDRVRDRARDVADIMQAQHVPGVVVRRMRDGSLCVGYMPAQARMQRNDCVPMIVFINNVRTSSDMLALQLPPDAIDHIVIYRPVEAGNLFGLGAGNGVITIFTR